MPLFAQEPIQRQRRHRVVGSGAVSGFEGPAPPYVANAVDFDGSNDNLLRGSDLTGNADGKQGTYSVWIRLDGGDGALQHSSNNTGGRLRLKRITSDIWEINLKNSGGSFIMTLKTATTYTASSTWLHLLLAWDLSVPVAHFFVNDVDDEAGGSTETDDTIDYTVADWSVGSTTGEGGRLNGCMAELYINTAEFIDISVQSNRRKFIDAAGKPISLGTDGRTPTGTAPKVYLNGDSTNFETNQGTGGNFSVTGSLTDCSTSPTD